MKIDLHIHTKYSTDGREEIGDIVRYAKKIGLGGIAITDHTSIRGWREAISAGKALGLIVIRGEEVSSSEGHILALGISSFIEKGLSPRETLEKIREDGGVAVAAHPYRMSNGVGERVVRDVDFDAIEGMNARSPHFINRRGIRLAKDVGKPITGGSDSHLLVEVGRAYTVFPENTESAEDVIDAIIGGKVGFGGKSLGKAEFLEQGFRKGIRWVGRGFRRI